MSILNNKRQKGGSRCKNQVKFLYPLQKWGSNSEWESVLTKWDFKRIINKAEEVAKGYKHLTKVVEKQLVKNNSYYSILVLLTAVLWGTTGTAQSFAPEGTSPLSIGPMRLLVGGIALLIFAGRKVLQSRRSLLKNKKMFIAAACIAGYQVFFFSGLLKTGVAVGTMVAIGSAPIFAGIISSIIFRQNPGLQWVLATALSIGGCILLLLEGQELATNLLGILLTLGAGFCYALYTAMSKDLLEEHSPEAVTGIMFLIGALFLSPFFFIYDLSWLKTIEGIGVILHLGLITSALAYILFFHGLTKIPFPNAVTLTLAEPLTASLLGIFLLKEQLDLFSKIGMLLIFAGLYSLSFTGNRRKMTVEQTKQL